MAAKAGRSLCLALALFEAARALQSGGPVGGFATPHNYGAAQQQQQQQQRHHEQVGSGLGQMSKASRAARGFAGLQELFFPSEIVRWSNDRCMCCGVRAL